MTALWILGAAWVAASIIVAAAHHNAKRTVQRRQRRLDQLIAAEQAAIDRIILHARATLPASEPVIGHCEWAEQMERMWAE